MDILKDGEIVLSGTVGGGFFEDGFTYLDVVEALATLGRNTDVTVRINSGGGIAAEGIAIFNAFDSHKGSVTMVIESIAASAASIIAMAGAEVVMRAGSTMMIHDPAAFTMGNSQEHAKSVEMLETMATSMADIYAEKTGRPAKETREEMKAETWMTPAQAVAKGYADKVEKGRTKEPTAFDYRLYQHAPERMVALAESRGWKHPRVPTGQQQESSMTVTSTAVATQPPATTTAADPAAAPVATAAPVTAATAAAAAPAAGDAVADAVTAERKRASDIHAACQMVGKPEKATAFISEGKSLSDVVAALQSDRASASPGNDVNTHHTKTTEAPAALSKAVDRVNARFTGGRSA